ncbi:tetratricopeptide repeat protein [bacterium]|nr:tetratricopeptide repeat protein [bacterium]
MIRKISYYIIVEILVALFAVGCAPRFYSADKSPSGYFKRGMKAMKEHRFNEAHFAFSELVNKYPDWEYADEALYKKGYLESVLGQYNDAVESFEKLLKDYPDSQWRFDASLWSGIIGELNACKGTNSAQKSKPKSEYQKNARDEIDKLESENAELRRQVQMLRKLLEE